MEGARAGAVGGCAGHHHAGLAATASQRISSTQASHPDGNQQYGTAAPLPLAERRAHMSM